MERTEEQQAIVTAGKTTSSNLMISALAGTGKTTTLEMIEREVTTRPILYLVFNKKNADEAEKRMLSTTTVRTFNSLGHRVWGKTNGKNLSLNPKKTSEIFKALVDQVKDRGTRDIMWDVYWEVSNGVALAKSLGYIPEGRFEHGKRLISRSDFHACLEEDPDDLVGDLIDAVLTKSITLAYDGSIDFNDQIYMPALFGGTFPRFPLVKVDEYQDLNPVNHAMLERLVRGRLIGVGDECQSIYGFRGARVGGMAEATKKYSMTKLNLSISFRCPEAVVDHARWRVPHFKSLKPGGEVRVLENLVGAGVADNAAIICRNNAPLFRVAFRLLACGRSVSVAGSDIGPKVVSQMKKLGSETMTQAQTLSAIDDWLSAKLEKGSLTAADMAECMKVFAQHGSDLGQAIRYAEHLFAQKGSIRLLTGHKAKGLEWDTVYHLDPWLCGESEQDLNLRYVITTRSKDRLFEIDSERIEW